MTESMNYIERVQHHESTIPNEYSDAYETLLGEGCAPLIAAAVVRYVAGQMGDRPAVTQRDAASRYGTTAATIRNHYPTIAPALRAGDPPSQHSTREVFYILYTSDSPMLLATDVIKRSDYATETVRKALRSLRDEGIAGNRYRDNTQKEWWAVPRADTPGFDNENPRSGLSKSDIVAEIAELRGWANATPSFDSHASGEYSITTGYSGRKGRIRDDGLEDLTGHERTILQAVELAESYGLVLGDDMTLTLSLNKSGLEKIHHHVSDSQEVSAED